MYRDNFGKKERYCVRFDAYETKVDVVGSLTVVELDRLIATLQQAREKREDADLEENWREKIK